MEFLRTLFADGALTFDDFANKVNENKNIKLANLADGGYVDKRKFDDSEISRKNAEKLLSEANQKLEGYDPNWKSEVEKANNAAAEQIKKIKLDNAISTALTAANVRDHATITPLLNMDKVAMDGEVLVGLTDQINDLKESHAYLFGSDTPHEPAGRAGSGMAHQDSSKPDYSSMSDEEYYATVLKS